MPTNASPSVIGANIKARRQTLNMTQRQLGDALGVHEITVSRWERGIAAPESEVLPLTARTLKCRIDDLYRERKPEPEAA